MLFENPVEVIDDKNSVQDSIQRLYRFDNGYGASVVRFKLLGGRYGSYTNDENEWELAVIKFYGKEKGEFSIDYDTGIAGDVIGHLSNDEVERTLMKIKKLKK